MDVLNDDFDTNRISSKSLYYKMDEVLHVSTSSLYDFRFLEFFNDGHLFHNDRMSWDSHYSFQHDDYDRVSMASMYTNIWR